MMAAMMTPMAMMRTVIPEPAEIVFIPPEILKAGFRIQRTLSQLEIKTNDAFAETASF
jgi:hypothetical protein